MCKNSWMQVVLWKGRMPTGTTLLGEGAPTQGMSRDTWKLLIHSKKSKIKKSRWWYFTYFAEVFILSIKLTHSIDINFIAMVYLHELIPNVSTFNKSSIHTVIPVSIRCSMRVCIMDKSLTSNQRLSSPQHTWLIAYPTGQSCGWYGGQRTTRCYLIRIAS
jgi:hypothetical protein